MGLYCLWLFSLPFPHGTFLSALKISRDGNWQFTPLMFPLYLKCFPHYQLFLILSLIMGKNNPSLPELVGLREVYKELLPICDEAITKNFSEEFLNHAAIIDWFGGELPKEKLKAMDKLIVNSIIKIAKTDPTFTVYEKIIPESITNFSNVLKEN